LFSYETGDSPFNQRGFTAAAAVVGVLPWILHFQRLRDRYMATKSKREVVKQIVQVPYWGSGIQYVSQEATMYDRSATWETGKDKSVPRNYTVTVKSVRAGSGGSKPPYGTEGDCDAIIWGSAKATLASNHAYGKFIGSLSDQSQWAVNFVESHEAVGMIVNRVKQITKFTRSLRKMDFAGAARDLGMKKPSGLRRSAKSFGDNWLEYHFGWEPLVKDIGAAIDTLSTPPPKRIIRGRGASEDLIFIKTDSGTSHNRKHVNRRWHFLYQGVAVCSSPLLASANDLGFVNPLSVVWETIPFSFVVDWFTNVGQVLNSATDTLGYTLTNTFVSQKYQSDVDNWLYYDDSYSAQVSNYHPISTIVQFIRHVGPIPGPSLEVPH
jgi:hypothetical protein